ATYVTSRSICSPSPTSPPSPHPSTRASPPFALSSTLSPRSTPPPPSAAPPPTPPWTSSANWRAWTAAATPGPSARSTPAATANGASPCAAPRSTAPAPACSPAAASSPTPTPTPSSPKPAPSSGPCSTPSTADPVPAGEPHPGPHPRLPVSPAPGSVLRRRRLAGRTPEQVPRRQLHRPHRRPAHQARLPRPPVHVHLAAVAVHPRRTPHRLRRVLRPDRV